MSEDCIEIRDLLARAVVGVNEHERRSRQDVLVNLRLFVDLRAAGRSDNLADSVDYGVVARQVVQCVESSNRFTLEALAEDIARVCLSMQGVRRVRVRVDKPRGLRFARSVGVQIERRAKGGG